MEERLLSVSSRAFTLSRLNTVSDTYVSFAMLLLGLPLSPRKSYQKPTSRLEWPPAIFCKTFPISIITVANLSVGTKFLK